MKAEWSTPPPENQCSSSRGGNNPSTAPEVPTKGRRKRKPQPTPPALSRAHKAELEDIFAQDKRLPTVDSRRAWANARGINPASVHAWFSRKRYHATARLGLTIPEGTYSLPLPLSSQEFPEIQDERTAPTGVKRERVSPEPISLDVTRPSKRPKLERAESSKPEASNILRKGRNCRKNIQPKTVSKLRHPITHTDPSSISRSVGLTASVPSQSSGHQPISSSKLPLSCRIAYGSTDPSGGIDIPLTPSVGSSQLPKASTAQPSVSLDCNTPHVFVLAGPDAVKCVNHTAPLHAGPGNPSFGAYTHLSTLRGSDAWESATQGPFPRTIPIIQVSGSMISRPGPAEIHSKPTRTSLPSDTAQEATGSAIAVKIEESSSDDLRNSVQVGDDNESARRAKVQNVKKRKRSATKKQTKMKVPKAEPTCAESGRLMRSDSCCKTEKKGISATSKVVKIETSTATLKSNSRKAATTRSTREKPKTCINPNVKLYATSTVLLQSKPIFPPVASVLLLSRDWTLSEGSPLWCDSAPRSVRRITFQTPETPRKNVSPRYPLRPAKCRARLRDRTPTPTPRRGPPQNRTLSHQHRLCDSSPLMASSDTLVDPSSSSLSIPGPDVSEDDKIPSLYALLLPSIHGNKKVEKTENDELDSIGSSGTSGATIRCGEEDDAPLFYDGTFEPPRTQTFDEFGLRLFGEIKWELSDDMWELSAIPWLAFVGCGGSSAVTRFGSHLASDDAGGSALFAQAFDICEHLEADNFVQDTVEDVLDSELFYSDLDNVCSSPRRDDDDMYL